jgi:ankyrin repeat protein
MSRGGPNQGSVKEAPIREPPAGALEMSSWLFIAVIKREEDVVKHLLQRGADIHYQYWDKKTVLHWAVTKPVNLVLIKMLANAITVNIQDRNGDTALHIASRNAYESVRDLWCARDDASSGDESATFWLRQKEEIFDADLYAISLLLAQWADLDIHNNERRTPREIIEENGECQFLDKSEGEIGRGRKHFDFPKRVLFAVD